MIFIYIEAAATCHATVSGANDDEDRDCRKKKRTAMKRRLYKATLEANYLKNYWNFNTVVLMHKGSICKI